MTQHRNALLFILPWLLSFLLFFIGPILASFCLSFTVFDGFSEPKIVGFNNYTRLANDGSFWQSLVVTMKFAFFNLTIGTSLALGLAIILNIDFKGRSLFRTLFYLPTVIPIVASSMVWIWIFKELRDPSFLSDTQLALPALVVISFWSLGNPMLIYLAGLQNISESMYESAELDGASLWQKFVHITLPSLAPVILFNVIIGLIQVFQYFVPAYIMTSGGPQSSTLFYYLYTYQKAFEDFQFGYASTLAWVLFFIVLAFSALAFKISKSAEK
jgi:multiple sugar transport system permease protein